jgi:phage virion morphogenesis protein
MRIIGEIVRTSVKKNFEAGGRPVSWKSSKAAEKEGRKTLVKTSRLMKSINARAYPDSTAVGTNVVYAAIHQKGGDIRHPARERTIFFKQYRGGRHRGRTLFSKEKKATMGMKAKGGAYTIGMPARPFIMVQDEDWQEIRWELIDFLTGGN